MELQIFKDALTISWSQETSYWPDEWIEGNPACGQCAVTALIVQDYFGGDIAWCRVELPNDKKPHYYNIIDGRDIDLTRSQFPEGSIIPKGIEKKKEFASMRECLLSNEDTHRRYDILKERVISNLK